MNSENLSHTIYQDHDIHGRTTAFVRCPSWPRLGAADDRAERFEVLLRLLLVVCVGAAMLACGAGTQASAGLADRTRPCAPVVQPAGLVAQAAAALRPTAVASKM